MENSVSSGIGLDNDTLLLVPPGEKSTHLTEGSIAGIVLGCIAAVVAFSKYNADSFYPTILYVLPFYLIFLGKQLTLW